MSACCPEIDIIRLKSLPYEKLVQNLIRSLRQSIDWIQNLDISHYKRPVLIQFLHDNRKKVAELIAIIDTQTVGCAGDTDLNIDEIDTVLDRHLFEFEEACHGLLQRLDPPKTTPNKIKTDRLKRLATLAFYCICSFVISTSTTYSIKKMQESHKGHELNWFVTMLQGCAVLPNFFIWIGTRLYQKDKIDNDRHQFWVRLRAYAVLGAVDAAHLMLISYSLVKLPGSIYTVLKGSGIIFSVVLSKLVVKKVFLFEHWLAVVFMCISTVGCALFESSESKEFTNFILGFSCTLASCFLVAMLGVLQQKLMSNHKHSDQTLLIMSETNFFQSLIVFPIVMITGFSSPESHLWRPVFTDIYARGDYRFFCLAGLLVLARSISVFSAMGVTTYSSAMFSRSYGAIRHSLQVIALSLLLHEGFQISKMFALAVSSVSFSIYIYAGHLLQQQKAGKKVTGLRGILCRK